MIRNKKGFTLIEMLAVIAIIAVLVAVIAPVVANATDKAAAATDAANLRSVLSLLNIHVVNGEETVDEIINDCANPDSKLDPDAHLYAVFNAPGFINVYYVTDDGTYYSLEYFSECSINGIESVKLAEIGTDRPLVEGDWYKAGEGKVTTLP